MEIGIPERQYEITPLKEPVPEPDYQPEPVYQPEEEPVEMPQHG